MHRHVVAYIIFTWRTGMHVSTCVCVHMGTRMCDEAFYAVVKNTQTSVKQNL